MEKLYMLTAVDVRRAETAGTSRPNIISTLTMPSINFVTANHNPGGGVGGVDFSMGNRIEPPEPAFSTKGFDTEIFGGMGMRDRFIFAGAYLEKRQNKTVPGRAIIEGAVVGWEPDESDPAEFQGCTHGFKEVTHYELILDGNELFYWDVWERVLRIAGVDRFAATRNALGA